MSTLAEQLENHIKAGTPLLRTDTIEQERFLEELYSVIQKYNKSKFTERVQQSNSAMEGFTGLRLVVCTPLGIQEYHSKQRTAQTITSALDRLISSQETETYGVIFAIPEAQQYINTPRPPGPSVIYQLVRANELLSHKVSKIILMGEVSRLPAVLDHLVPMLDYGKPSKAQIEETIEETMSSLWDAGKGTPPPKGKKKLIENAARAVVGLTASQVNQALLESYCANDHVLKPDQLFQAKVATVRASGLLEHIGDSTNIEEVGGLEYLKEWLGTVSALYSNPEKAEKAKLPVPKGCLVAGIPGTGKTLTAKAASYILGLPLYRCNVGKLFHKFVGETERLVRELFDLISAVSPCVVLIDEAEKALAGTASSDQSDSGVTARMFAELLHFLQEKKDNSFFVLTANDVTSLPPELLRPGRLDELWFVNLPGEGALKEIWQIHLKKLDIPAVKSLSKLAKASKGFTGAEVENCVRKAAYRAFVSSSEVTEEMLQEAIKSTKPLSKQTTVQKTLSTMIEWGETCAQPAGKSIESNHWARAASEEAVW